MTPDNLGTPTSRATSLLQLPIVLALDPQAVPLIRAGLSRAGKDPVTVLVIDPDLPAMLAAVHEADAGCLLASCSSPEKAIEIAALALSHGGRPLPVIGVDHGEADAGTLEVLGASSLASMNVPVPSMHGAARDTLWNSLRAARIEDRHHLVEVDGRPAVEERREQRRRAPADGDDAVAGLEGAGALAAGAAGVLAGRLAFGDRRWRGDGA